MWRPGSSATGRPELFDRRISKLADRKAAWEPADGESQPAHAQVEEASCHGPASSAFRTTQLRHWPTQSRDVPWRHWYRRSEGHRSWNRSAGRMQSADCGFARQHWRRHRRPSPDELSDAWQTRSRLQLDAKTTRERISPRRTDPLWTDSITQINSLVAGRTIRVRREIDPCGYRRTGTTQVPRSGCFARERAHCKCW